MARFRKILAKENKVSAGGLLHWPSAARNESHFPLLAVSRKRILAMLVLRSGLSSCCIGSSGTAVPASEQ